MWFRLRTLPPSLSLSLSLYHAIRFYRPSLPTGLSRPHPVFVNSCCR